MFFLLLKFFSSSFFKINTNYSSIKNKTQINQNIIQSSVNHQSTNVKSFSHQQMFTNVRLHFWGMFRWHSMLFCASFPLSACCTSSTEFMNPHSHSFLFIYLFIYASIGNILKFHKLDLKIQLLSSKTSCLTRTWRLIKRLKRISVTHRCTPWRGIQRQGTPTFPVRPMAFKHVSPGFPFRIYRWFWMGIRFNQ